MVRVRIGMLLPALLVVVAAAYGSTADSPRAAASAFDGNAAYESVRRQVALGPRPAAATSRS